MQSSQLRRILHGIVIAGLPALASGCFLGGDDADEPCTEEGTANYTVALPAADAEFQTKIDACQADSTQCSAVCSALYLANSNPFDFYLCEATFSETTLTVHTEYTHQIRSCGADVGRRPAGLVEAAAGSWLAKAAWLEAASVPAFARLAQELEAFGAPAALVRAAWVAMADEVRHTAAMTKLAHRYGHAVPAVELATVEARDLEAFAMENVVEGCVRETWGAAIALWQAQTARDPEVRATLAVIANDEIRHAQLAWLVDAWVATRLDAPARARVIAARTAAATALLAEANTPVVAAALAAELGLPLPSDARPLAERTAAALWA